MRWAAATKTNLSLRHPFEVHIVDQGPKVAAVIAAAGTQPAAVQKMQVAAGEQVLLTKSGQNPFASCSAPTPQVNALAAPQAKQKQRLPDDSDEDEKMQTFMSRFFRRAAPPSQVPPAPPLDPSANSPPQDHFNAPPAPLSHPSADMGLGFGIQPKARSMRVPPSYSSPFGALDATLGPGMQGFLGDTRKTSPTLVPPVATPTNRYRFGQSAKLDGGFRRALNAGVGPSSDGSASTGARTAHSSGQFQPHFIDPSAPGLAGKPAEVIPTACLVEQPVKHVFDADTGVRVLVHEADLLRLVVESVAVPTDGGLGNSGGVGRAIERAAGKRMRPLINKFRDGLPGAGASYCEMQLLSYLLHLLYSLLINLHQILI